MLLALRSLYETEEVSIRKGGKKYRRHRPPFVPLFFQQDAAPKAIGIEVEIAAGNCFVTGKAKAFFASATLEHEVGILSIHARARVTFKGQQMTFQPGKARNRTHSDDDEALLVILDNA